MAFRASASAANFSTTEIRRGKTAPVSASCPALLFFGMPRLDATFAAKPSPMQTVERNVTKLIGAAQMTYPAEVDFLAESGIGNTRAKIAST